jgi:hypothetical protein
MVRNYINDVPLASDEFVIDICGVENDIFYKVVIKENDTILLLKEFMSDLINAYLDEQMYMICSTSPYYSLWDDTIISRDHYKLFLIVCEASYTSIPQRYHASIPQRYYSKYIHSKDGADTEYTVLDLRYIMPDHIRHIGRSFHLDRYISIIYLSATHPCINEILYEISENILALYQLEKIHIQHPDSPDYEYPSLHPPYFIKTNPIFSEQSMKSHVSSDALHYLYQHLLLDQYRHITTPVRIILDPNVLNNSVKMVYDP